MGRGRAQATGVKIGYLLRGDATRTINPPVSDPLVRWLPGLIQPAPGRRCFYCFGKKKKLRFRVGSNGGGASVMVDSTVSVSVLTNTTKFIQLVNAR